jgi:hypothetical protein
MKSHAERNDELADRTAKRRTPHCPLRRSALVSALNEQVPMLQVKHSARFRPVPTPRAYIVHTITSWPHYSRLCAPSWYTLHGLDPLSPPAAQNQTQFQSFAICFRTARHMSPSDTDRLACDTSKINNLASVEFVNERSADAPTHVTQAKPPSRSKMLPSPRPAR